MIYGLIVIEGREWSCPKSGNCFSAFDFQHLIVHLCLSCMRPLNQQVLLRSVYLLIIFDLTQHILTWFIKDDEKSLLWSDFFFFFLDGSSQTCYILCLCDVLGCYISLSHKDGICKWCLLIPMNNKDWYFFLWKKKKKTQQK